MRLKQEILKLLKGNYLSNLWCFLVVAAPYITQFSNWLILREVESNVEMLYM